MAVVSALFSCSAMDMPCTQHMSFPDAFAAAVGDASQTAPVALLRVAGDGRIVHQIGWPDTLPPVQGRAIHTLFRELEDDGHAGGPVLCAAGNMSRHVWHLRDSGQAVCVECARLPIRRR